MNICFDCGGGVKMLAKPGRMYYPSTSSDREERVSCEIPPELKIPTCVECGTVNEDVFLKAKLDKIYLATVKNGGLKYAMINYIDNSIHMMFKRPKTFGSAAEILLQLFVYLDLRYFAIHKEKMDSIFMTRAWIDCVQNKAKIGNCLSKLNDLDLGEVIEMYRIFVDRFVFVEGASLVSPVQEVQE